MGHYEQQADEKLSIRVGKGDRDAFAVLFDRYFEDLYDFAIRMTRDQAAAADVVQGTFVKAWENLKKHRIPKISKPGYIR